MYAYNYEKRKEMILKYAEVMDFKRSKGEVLRKTLHME
jgi:hypothetical protein